MLNPVERFVCLASLFDGIGALRVDVLGRVSVEKPSEPS